MRIFVDKSGQMTKEIRLRKIPTSTYDKIKGKADNAGASPNAYCKRVIFDHAESPGRMIRYGHKSGTDIVTITNVSPELKKGLANVALQKGYFSLSEYLRVELKKIYENTEDRFKIPVPPSY